MFRQLATFITTVGDLLDDMLVGDAELDELELDRWRQGSELRTQACSPDSSRDDWLDDGDVLVAVAGDDCDGGRHYTSRMPAPARRAGEVPPPVIECDTPVSNPAVGPRRLTR
jgi:hypothetical protein